MGQNRRTRAWAVPVLVLAFGFVATWLALRVAQRKTPGQ